MDHLSAEPATPPSSTEQFSGTPPILPSSTALSGCVGLCVGVTGSVSESNETLLSALAACPDPTSGHAEGDGVSRPLLGRPCRGIHFA